MLRLSRARAGAQHSASLCASISLASGCKDTSERAYLVEQLRLVQPHKYSVARRDASGARTNSICARAIRADARRDGGGGAVAAPSAMASTHNEICGF